MLEIPTPKSKKGNFWGIRFLTVYLMLFVLYRHIFRVLCDSRSQHSQTKYTIVPFGMLKIICLSILDDITKKTKNLELVKGRYCSIQIHSKSYQHSFTFGSLKILN